MSTSWKAKRHSDVPIFTKSLKEALETTMHSSNALVFGKQYGSVITAESTLDGNCLGNYLQKLGTVPNDDRISQESPLKPTP